MQEVGLPESLVTERYMEVWNKIDLVIDEEAFKEKVERETEQAKYPVVLMSATQGYNKKVFLEEVSEMVQRILGKDYVTI
jgi:50S ribosomal subunit-associated GTPase HflX